jgi:hypothetical protein
MGEQICNSGSWGRRALALLAVIIALVCGVAAWRFWREQPKPVIQRFMAACSEGNESAARALVSQDSLDLVPKWRPRRNVSELFAVNPNDGSYIIEQLQIMGDKAVASIRVQKPEDMSGGETGALPVAMVLESDGWKIDLPETLGRAKFFPGFVRTSLLPWRYPSPDHGPTEMRPGL